MKLFSWNGIALPGAALAALLLGPPGAAADDAQPQVRTLTYQRTLDAAPSGTVPETDAADVQFVRHRRGFGRGGFGRGFGRGGFGRGFGRRGFSISLGFGRSYGFGRPFGYGYGYRPYSFYRQPFYGGYGGYHGGFGGYRGFGGFGGYGGYGCPY